MTLGARSHESGCNLGGKPPITLCKYETHKVIGRPRFNNYWGRKVTPKGKAGQHLIFQPMQSKMFPPVALFRVKIYIQEKKENCQGTFLGCVIAHRSQYSVWLPSENSLQIQAMKDLYKIKYYIYILI